METFAANDLVAWALIAASGAYALTAQWMPNGAAVVMAALAALLTKTALLDLV